MNKIEIFPTAVPQDLTDLQKRAHGVKTFSKLFHIDADDGIFVPLMCWPYHAPGRFEDFDLSAVQDLEVEVHLMVQDPREIGRRFARAGARAVFGHVETFRDSTDARETLASWKDAGAHEVGMAVLLETDLATLESFVPLCDFLCLMSSAQIGAQGAQFDPRVIDRANVVHQRYPHIQIEVDIGVSERTIAGLVRVGVSRFAVGSAIVAASDPAYAYLNLMSIAENALQ